MDIHHLQLYFVLKEKRKQTEAILWSSLDWLLHSPVSDSFQCAFRVTDMLRLQAMTVLTRLMLRRNNTPLNYSTAVRSYLAGGFSVYAVA